jgi:hypothetical protein|tara:strand:+ start:840 stop:1430 length:591 start_codon:yes stop_codon:yes gene_type:complete
MSIAFVVGNGISRLPVNLTSLKKYGSVYACNAVYREFSPDYLIAVDSKMIVEICESGYQLRNIVWTNENNKRHLKYEKLNFFQPSKGWSSGPTALWLASQHKHKTIYILGFDFKGINEDKVNNIFSGTKNYKPTDANSTYYGNWLRQTRNVILENQNISYKRVIALDNFCPEELNNYNYSTEIIEDFLSKLQNGSF